MRLIVLTPAEFRLGGEYAHLICFNESRPADTDRIDFALLAMEDAVTLGYMTCYEHDKKTVYIQHGGTFESARDTVKSYKAFSMAVGFLRDQYAFGNMYVENKNKVMLKFAMKQGFEVTGVKNFKGKILLEHSIQWKDE